MSKPGTFAGSDSEEIQFIKNFEKSCVVLNQHLNKDAKTMTVIEYMQASEQLEKQFKEQAKKGKRK